MVDTLLFVLSCIPRYSFLLQQIKETVTTTATQYLERVQNSVITKVLTTQAENLVSLSELMTEIVLPTDGNSKEDMEELAEPSDEKGPIVRTQMLTRRLARRGKTKLMSCKPVQLSLDAVSGIPYSTCECKVIDK